MESKTKRICPLIIILLLCILSFFLGRMSMSAGQKNEPAPEHVIQTDHEGVKELIRQKKDFILYLERSSCRQCAIVNGEQDRFAGHVLPVYVLNMEQYRDTDTYDTIKDELGFMYVPCFKYFKDGEQMAHINNPLSDDYFHDTSTGAERNQLREEMVERVISFIEAAAGNGELISEDPRMPQVTVEEVPAPPEIPSDDTRKD